MRKLVLVLLVGSLAAPASALAADRHVTMQRNSFRPNALQVLTGEKVIWTNNDSREHNVTSFQFPSSAPRLPTGERHEWTFGAPGRYAYRCTLHGGMSGSVTVADVHLRGPATTLTYGAAGRFSGLAPEGQPVVLRAADGTDVASTTAGAAGGFAFTVTMIRPGRYFAVSGGEQSGAAVVRVRPRLAIAARRSGSRLAVAVSAKPSQARARVVLERRHRARWVRIARGRLNASSKATFRVARRAMKIRARTTRGIGGYTAATSRVLRVR